MSSIHHDSAVYDSARADLAHAMAVLADAQGHASTDDECVRRLDVAIQGHDAERLDEVASLIGRLAVTLEI